MFQFSKFLCVLCFVFLGLSGPASANDTAAENAEASPTDIDEFEIDKRTYLVINRIGGQLNDDEYGPTKEYRGQSRKGYEITFGARVSDHFAAEFGFSHLGAYRIYNSRFDITERVSLTTFQIDLLTYLYESGNRPAGPGIPGFSLFVKTGASRCNHNSDFYRLCGKYNFNLGLGTDIHLHRNFAIRFEAQTINNDIYTARAGFRFRGEFVDVLAMILSSAPVYN